jgi:hypothetical protein
MNELVPVQNLIYEIRGQKVMLDSDLARLYNVEVKRLNEAVKRNIERFPEDFMFQLTTKEWHSLRSQFATLKNDQRKYSPYVFTEQGVAMLSSVLNSKQAIAVNIQIMRTFVQVKQFALTNKELTERLNEFEHRFIQYAKDMNINVEDIYKQLNYLADRTKPTKIGFTTEEK